MQDVAVAREEVMREVASAREAAAREVAAAQAWATRSVAACREAAEQEIRRQSLDAAAAADTVQEERARGSLLLREAGARQAALQQQELFSLHHTSLYCFGFGSGALESSCRRPSGAWRASEAQERSREEGSET